MTDSAPVNPIRTSVDRVDWARILRFPHLFRALSLASSPQRIFLGTAIIVLLMSGGYLWDSLSGTDTFGKSTVPFIADLFRDVANDALELNPGSAVASLFLLPWTAAATIWKFDAFYKVFFGLFFLLVWYVGGCTIARTAATEFALDRADRWTDAFAFSLRRWIPLTATVLLPLLLVAVGLGLLALGGLALRVPYLDVAAAALPYGLALFGSFLLACLVVLFLPAQTLFIPAVAVESADTPDALSRSFSYVKNRPLHFLAYSVFLAVQGILGFLLVAAIASLTLKIVATGLDLAGHDVLPRLVDAPPFLDHPPESDLSDLGTGTSLITARILNVWNTLVVALVCGWVVSYVFSARVMLYFVMRHAVDQQDFDEIWVPGLIESTMAPDRAVKPESTGA